MTNEALIEAINQRLKHHKADKRHYDAADDSYATLEFECYIRELEWVMRQILGVEPTMQDLIDSERT